MNNIPTLASMAQDIANLRSDVQELHRHITSSRKLTHRDYIIEQLQPIPGLSLLEKSALASTYIPREYFTTELTTTQARSCSCCSRNVMVC
jgi:hypothetical protein